MVNPISRHWLVFVLLYTVLSPLFAQEVGEAVLIRDPMADDVYAAGGTVDVLAPVEGDVVVAGGRVFVGESVTGDVMAVGGEVSVGAVIGDDARLAGGDIRLSGSVGDDAMAAGGNVTLTPSGSVRGRAWFSGGRIDVAGAIGRDLKAAGGRILLSGRVRGDVELRGGTIRILDGAIIDGDLVYRSPREAEIASGAEIRGTVRYEPVERPVMGLVAAVVGVGIVFLLGLMVTGSAMFLMFPRFIAAAVTTLRAEPWKCLGLGLAVFAATPVVIGMLFVTVIGWLPALVIGALYPILLLAGFLTAAFYVGDLGWRRLKRGEASTAGRLWSFVVAMILMTLIGLVPLLGALLLFVLMLLGTGGLKLGLYRNYMTRSAN
jgi:cytoskeletal protein CcmA (bactofilin family)